MIKWSIQDGYLEGFQNGIFFVKFAEELKNSYASILFDLSAAETWV